MEKIINPNKEQLDLLIEYFDFVITDKDSPMEDMPLVIEMLLSLAKKNYVIDSGQKDIIFDYIKPSKEYKEYLNALFDLNYYFWTLREGEEYFKKPISEIAEDIINEKKLDFDSLENKDED